MSSERQAVPVRDLVEEAKKRIVLLVVCVVGLSYLMSPLFIALITLPADQYTLLSETQKELHKLISEGHIHNLQNTVQKVQQALPPLKESLQKLSDHIVNLFESVDSLGGDEFLPQPPSLNTSSAEFLSQPPSALLPTQHLLEPTLSATPILHTALPDELPKTNFLDFPDPFWSTKPVPVCHCIPMTCLLDADHLGHSPPLRVTFNLLQEYKDHWHFLLVQSFKIQFKFSSLRASLIFQEGCNDACYNIILWKDKKSNQVE